MKMFSCLILIMLIIHVECKNKFARDMRKKIRDSNGGRPTGPAPRNNDCVDDLSTTDIDGDDCGYYDWVPNACGEGDDSDFNANEQCCACQGGDTSNSSGDDYSFDLDFNDSDFFFGDASDSCADLSLTIETYFGPSCDISDNLFLSINDCVELDACHQDGDTWESTKCVGDGSIEVVSYSSAGCNDADKISGESIVYGECISEGFMSVKVTWATDVCAGGKQQLLATILGIASGVFFAALPLFIIFGIAQCRQIPPDTCWTNCCMKWLCCCFGFGYVPVVCWEGFNSRVILACFFPCYTVCCWTPVELTTKPASHVDVQRAKVQAEV